LRRLPPEFPGRNQVIAALVAPLLLLTVSRAALGADDGAAARGAYLAAAAGCGECHTDSQHAGLAYAGGRVLLTEFGPIVSPNITPDEATGIGGWRLVDFVRAMRWGLAPDGTHYTTAFPFPSFAQMTDGDLADLKAYLDSLPPVSRPGMGGAPDLALLARARAAFGAALAANSPPEPISADPRTARGQYLASGVGRCGDCHTPQTWYGVPDEGHRLAGSDGWFTGKKAPDITSGPKSSIAAWSEDDIAELLKTGGTPDGDFVGGIMAEIVRATEHLTDDDRHAIAAYLKSLPLEPPSAGR